MRTFVSLMSAMWLASCTYQPAVAAVPSVDQCGITAAAAENAQARRQRGMTVSQAADYVREVLMPRAHAAGVTEYQWSFIIRGFEVAYSSPMTASPKQVRDAAFTQCVTTEV